MRRRLIQLFIITGLPLAVLLSGCANIKQIAQKKIQEEVEKKMKEAIPGLDELDLSEAFDSSEESSEASEEEKDEDKSDKDDDSGRKKKKKDDKKDNRDKDKDKDDNDDDNDDNNDDNNDNDGGHSGKGGYNDNKDRFRKDNDNDTGRHLIESDILEYAKKHSGAPNAIIEDVEQDGTLDIRLFGISNQDTWNWYYIDPSTLTGTDILGEYVDLREEIED